MKEIYVKKSVGDIASQVKEAHGGETSLAAETSMEGSEGGSGGGGLSYSTMPR